VCWLCDHPGATELDYQDHLRQLIDTFGWAVQGVERDGIHPPWAYTVGLTPRRRPELVITGMGLTRATQVLNGVAAHLLHAGAPEPGTQAALLDGPLVEVVRVATPWAHLNMAVEFYGRRIRGLREEHMAPLAAWMDEAVTAATKDDEATLDRIAGEVRDLLAAFPAPGWQP